MWRPDGLDRTTYRGPDQAPSSATNPGSLKCRSRFIVAKPTLLQAGATSVPSPPKFRYTLLSCRLFLCPSPGASSLRDRDLCWAQRVHHTALPLDIPPQRLPHKQQQFKTHSTFVPNPKRLPSSRRIETTAATAGQLSSAEFSLWPRWFRYGPRGYRKVSAITAALPNGVSGSKGPRSSVRPRGNAAPRFRPGYGGNPPQVV